MNIRNLNSNWSDEYRKVPAWLVARGQASADQAQWLCPHCMADRLKQSCGDPHSGQCPMVGATQKEPKEPA